MGRRARAFIQAIEVKTLDSVRLVLRASRDVALKELDLDRYWDGTIDVVVPVE